MSRWRSLLIGMFVLSLGLCARSETTAQEYLDTARPLLFNGTLSGIRQGNALLDEAMADPDCSDCQTHRELLFFHACSELVMVMIGDDAPPTDSFFEWLAHYGVTPDEDYCPWAIDTIHWKLNEFDHYFPDNRYGQPEMDEIERNAANLIAFMQAGGLDSLDTIIDELEQINDTPEDRFRLFIQPEEIAAFQDYSDTPLSQAVEVDYAEVLMLRGILYMLRGMMNAESAYDTCVEAEDRLVEKFYENTFSLKHDLLLPHPDFLKRLPTANDPNDGAAIMAQARQDILTGLQYYTDLVDYLWNENIPAGTDPQDNELLAFDPNDRYVSDRLLEHVAALTDSLQNDTPLQIDGKRTQWYRLANTEADSVDIRLQMLATGQYDDVEIYVNDSGMNYTFYDADVEILGEHVTIYADSEGFFGYLSGTINTTRTLISHATFEYSGWDSGTITGLSGPLSEDFVEEQWTVDPNPVFGDSPRYPEPLSPRALLPEFSTFNKPVAGTLPDVTFGGVLPQATQADWIQMADPQPDTAIPYWSEVQPWQMIGGYPGIWLNEQLIFADATGDTGEGGAPAGSDIKELYMGFDDDYLYGCVILNEPPDSGYYYQYDLVLSYCPANGNVIDTLKMQIKSNYGAVSGQLFRAHDDFGHLFWGTAAFPEVQQNGNLMNFRILWEEIPLFLSGRYVTLDAAWGYDEWSLEETDENTTHIQVGMTGSISGTVTFAGHRGGPIFVQAYSDLDDPEDSIVATAMLDEPGPFTLENIGLGFDGYIRAFSPLFGQYHLGDMDALKAEDRQPVYVYTQNVTGVTLNLQVPTVLKNNVWVSDAINHTTNLNDYFAFDAVKDRLYTVQIARSTADYAQAKLLDRNGNDDELTIYEWETEKDWLCSTSGRYYIAVADAEWYNPSYGGSYQLRISTSFDLPAADVSGPQWLGVKDGQVNLHDLSLLTTHWLSDCSVPYWCDETDYNQDGTVDLDDLATMVEEWMQGDFDGVSEFQREDFETGGFSSPNWTFSGQQSWTVTSDPAYQGTYCARSGNITHNQTSVISLTVQVDNPSVLRFACKTSCQSTDYIEFKLDGIWQERQGGAFGNWQQKTYDISPGIHTFTWSYVKNGSISEGMDCVWIDDIELTETLIEI